MRAAGMAHVLTLPRARKQLRAKERASPSPGSGFLPWLPSVKGLWVQCLGMCCPWRPEDNL